MDFAIQFKQQGTTEKQALAAAEKRKNAPTVWRLLCEYFVEQRQPVMGFLFLAGARRVDMTLEQMAKSLELDVWDCLSLYQRAEARLRRQGQYARRFRAFLAGFDAGEREQAATVQECIAKTYEEIALELGCNWQRVQQIEHEALEKLRKNPKALELLMEVRQ